MISMLIELDLTKLERDGYDAEAVRRLVDKRFSKACSKITDGAATLYEGIEGKDYFTEISIAYVNLKKQDWFAKYCRRWLWIEDDKYGNVYEEDCLKAERLKNPLFMKYANRDEDEREEAPRNDSETKKKTVELKRVTLKDAETLRRLHYCDASLDDVRRMIREWNRSEYWGKYFKVFTIVLDDQLVGELSIAERSKSVVSIGIEIFSEYRRRGFGKQAMTSALQICKSEGYKIVCNQVPTDNEPSIALHNGYGFESDTYPYRDQNGQDMYTS